MRYIKNEGLMYPRFLLEYYNYSYTYMNIFIQYVKLFPQFNHDFCNIKWNRIWQYYVYKVLGFEKITNDLILDMTNNKLGFRIDNIEDLGYDVLYDLWVHIYENEVCNEDDDFSDELCESETMLNEMLETFLYNYSNNGREGQTK